MNVLFLTTHLNTGGITSYLLTLGKALRQMGHAIHLGSSGGNMEQEFLSAGIQLVPINIRTKSELSGKIHGALRPLGQYVRDHKIDLVHAQTRVTQVLASLLSRRARVICVSTCHGFFKPRLLRKLFPCWGMAVIAISPAVEEHLLKDFKVSKDKVVLIENGIDLERFPLSDETTRRSRREQLGLGEGPVIGMIARLSDVKGPDVLVEAMRKIRVMAPSVKAVFVGEGKMEKSLRSLVDQYGLNDRVVFYPIVNRTSDMLAAFDLFFMPSRQEGLGLSVMEAQAAGLPVVASRVGGLRNLIDDGRTGVLVEPQNSAELAEAIVALLNDPPRKARIAAAGHEFIQRSYSARRMAERTALLYERLLSSKGH